MDMICEGCGDSFRNFLDQHPVCMDCVRARHRAATTTRGGCKCGRKARPTEEKAVGSRRWISCFRCLGQIRQLA